MGNMYQIEFIAREITEGGRVVNRYYNTIWDNDPSSPDTRDGIDITNPEDKWFLADCVSTQERFTLISQDNKDNLEKLVNSEGFVADGWGHIAYKGMQDKPDISDIRLKVETNAQPRHSYIIEYAAEEIEASKIPLLRSVIYEQHMASKALHDAWLETERTIRALQK